MKRFLKSFAVATVIIVAAVSAYAGSVVTAPYMSTSGTYMDFMKTVYNRAGRPPLIQLPLTSFDKDYKLHGLAAESWSASDDGKTWTFVLREGLTWSDGEPLKASDYIFALQRAATTGYDFAWYWSFAGGIKNWKAVTKGDIDVSKLGLSAPDDRTIIVETNAPKSYLPGVVSLWYPVPKHVWDKYGDGYALNVDTLVSSGPFIVVSWEKSNNKMTFIKNPKYHGPWQAKIDKLIIDPSVGQPEVGFPAYLAGDTDLTALNAGQVAFAEKRYKANIRRNAIFAVSYLSFDMESAPFDNLDVRKAFWYAINRDELTNTVLKNQAIPAKSLLAPGFPGYNEKITSLATFDPEKAREYLAKAGFPGGKGFPAVEVWYRIQGGYNGAITAPMLQYLQAEFKKHLGIKMGIKKMSRKDWMDALLKKKNNLFLAPYEYDYLDPSNFYDIFFSSGRHGYKLESYDKLVKAADANPNWEKRLALYEKAEMELINNAAIIPLVHPITIALIRETLTGEATLPNQRGYFPLDRLALYFFTHIEKK